jgi:hypothetical protein
VKKLLTLISFSIATLVCFGEQSTDSLWAQGNLAYQKGNYEAASSNYNAILGQGLHSPDLYFNLGNTYYKQNRIAESILSYERAIRFSPSNEIYKYNLEVAKAKVIDKIEIIPPFFIYSWINSIKSIMSINGWAITILILFLILVSSILLWRFGFSILLKRFGFWCSLCATLLFIISTLLCSSIASKNSIRDEAIILRPVVTVKSSPDQNGKDLFILHEGTKVQITDSLSRWIEVKISDGNSGWINTADLERI